jgi:hypothetical protein
MTYPIHYYGPIPLKNRDSDVMVRAAELNYLRDIYTAQWLASIDLNTAKTLQLHDIAVWRAVHDDTTSYYRTGSRQNYI